MAVEWDHIDDAHVCRIRKDQFRQVLDEARMKRWTLEQMTESAGWYTMIFLQRHEAPDPTETTATRRPGGALAPVGTDSLGHDADRPRSADAGDAHADRGRRGERGRGDRVESTARDADAGAGAARRPKA